ncbi:MAG: ABC transporter substrate-binding protein [Gammaproteobacteria bacterium]
MKFAPVAKIAKQIAVLAAAVSLSAGAQANTLKMAYDADPVSLDPHEYNTTGTLQFSHLAFDPLVRWTRDLQFEPRLAESWERTDDLTMRFNLRRGVKFHSGNTMTAADVCWTLARLKKSPDFKALYEPFVSCDEKGDYTAELKTRKPFPLVLHLAAYIFPMDRKFYSGADGNGGQKDAIIKHGGSFASQNVSGTGPFIITKRQQGVRMELARFADYWDAESPGNVEKIIFTPIAKSATRVAALLSGDVDFIAPVPPNDLARILRNRKINLITLPGPRIINFQLNQKRQPAFADSRVRLAIVYAVDNRAIAKKIMKGFATPAAQQSPQGYSGHNPKLKPRYDLAKAKALMAEAGYADGFTASMMAPNNRYVNDARIAEAVAGMLGKIGIKINLKTMPKAQYWPKFDERAADIMMIGWLSDTQDSGNFSEFLLMCPDKETGYGQYNTGNYCNPTFDRLVLDVQSETNEKVRAIRLQKIEEIAHKEAAFVPLHWQNLAWAARKGVNIKPVVNVQNLPYLGDLVMEK